MSKAPKVLIVDTDRGLSSLAPDDRIEDVFGYKPRRFIRSKSIQIFRDKMFENYVQVDEDALGPVENEYWKLKSGKELDYIVWDSLTSWQAMKREELKAESNTGKMTQNSWGDLADDLEELVTTFERSDVPFIATCHTKQVDDGSGTSTYGPSIQGRMKHELTRHFDIVAYSLASANEKGTREYKWQILADEYRAAGCRFDEISKWAAKNNGCIPPDFGLLTTKLQEAGYTKFNMLIIGPPKTGKTYSLRTLNDAKKLISQPTPSTKGDTNEDK